MDSGESQAYSQIRPHTFGSLCLASAATQTPRGAALASPTDTSGLSDNQPVLAHRGGRAACGRGAWFRPGSFYPTADCLLERAERSVGKVRMGELSLWLARVPKPTSSARGLRH